MSLHNLCLFIVSSGANKGIFEAVQEVSLLLLAVKINFLLIKLTKQIALSYFRCRFPILFADTGESWSTDSPAKQKTMWSAIDTNSLPETKAQD